MCHIEMLTRDLKKSNDNLVVHGKLIINLSTTLGPTTNTSGQPGSSLSVANGAGSSSLNGGPPRSPVSTNGPSSEGQQDHHPPRSPGHSQGHPGLGSASTASQLNGGHPSGGSGTGRGLSLFADNQGRLPAGWERREDKVILKELITSITTHGPQPGHGHQPHTTRESRELPWKRIPRWSDEHTKTACCQEIAPELIHQA